MWNWAQPNEIHSFKVSILNIFLTLMTSHGLYWRRSRSITQIILVLPTGNKDLMTRQDESVTPSFDSGQQSCICFMLLISNKNSKVIENSLEYWPYYVPMLILQYIIQYTELQYHVVV